MRLDTLVCVRPLSPGSAVLYHFSHARRTRIFPTLWPVPPAPTTNRRASPGRPGCRAAAARYRRGLAEHVVAPLGQVGQAPVPVLLAQAQVPARREIRQRVVGRFREFVERLAIGVVELFRIGDFLTSRGDLLDQRRIVRCRADWAAAAKSRRALSKSARATAPSASGTSASASSLRTAGGTASLES